MSLHTVAGRPAGRVLCCADFPERNFEGPSPHHIREALRVRVDSREAITKHLVTPRDRLRRTPLFPCQPCRPVAAPVSPIPPQGSGARRRPREPVLALKTEGTVGCIHEDLSRRLQPRSRARGGAAFGFGEGISGQADRDAPRKPYSGGKGVALFSRNRAGAAHHRPPRWA